MTNKKVASEIAVGIILLIAVVVGGIFWMQKTEIVEVKPGILKNDLNVATKNKPTEKIVYLVHHWASMSPYERAKANTANDEYSEIFDLDLKSGVKTLLFSDKNEDYFIQHGVGIFKENTVFFVAKKRLYDSSMGEELSNKLLNLLNKEISDFPKMPVTEKFIFNNYVSVLPDGKFVYAGVSDNGSSIFVSDKDLKNSKEIFSTHEYGDAAINSMAISRDGQKIAFSVGKDGVGQATMEENIFVMTIDGSELKQIFKKKTIGNVIEWFPDNKTLFINKDNSEDYYVINMEGKSELMDKIKGAPAISPNGSKIVFNRYISAYDGKPDSVSYGSYHSYVSELDGSNPIEILSMDGKRDSADLSAIGWVIN